MVDFYSEFKDFKSFEVVFHNKEGELQKIYCVVKRIEHDRIILDANNQKNQGIFANQGDEFNLHIYTENGIYSATSKIMQVTTGTINTEYVIAYPANSKHSQRREYFRADILVPFKLNIFTEEESETPVVVSSRTKNICGKGMSYVSDTVFPAHNLVELELTFPEKVINTQAELVYSKQIVVNNRPKFVHAFTFTTINKTGIDFIVKKCFLHQLDLRKKLMS